jgi:hypothetical protein
MSDGVSEIGAAGEVEVAGEIDGGRWKFLPEWLQPRDRELEGTGRRRLVEVTLLILAGLLLAVATVNDLIEQTHVNHRLIADLRTWRQYTGHDYKNISTEQDLYGHTTRDVVCGNTTPGPPKERVQLCLLMTGPVLDGRRAVHGGWYLRPKVEDVPIYRYGCFGTATPTRFCGKAAAASVAATDAAERGESSPTERDEATPTEAGR